MELTILAARVQQGDEEAFAEICGRFKGLVKKYANQPHLRPLGEEAEAEAWLAVVKAVRTYRPQSGVPIAGYIESQVKYTLWNLFKKERRKWRRETVAEADGGDEGPSLLDTLQARDNVEAAVELRELSQGLQCALAELPERQNRAIILTLVEGRRLIEAGRELGVSPQAVHNLQQRGLVRLRAMAGGRFF